MKVFIHILFFSISVLFSFGFTTYKSSCEPEIIKHTTSETNHSCCHKKEKKPDCTQSKDCKADCCLQSSNLYIFNDFITSHKSNKKAKNIVLKQQRLVINTCSLQLRNHIYYVNNKQIINSKSSGRQIISLKQSWLI